LRFFAVCITAPLELPLGLPPDIAGWLDSLGGLEKRFDASLGMQITIIIFFKAFQI
jgi:hypothetical protein